MGFRHSCGSFDILRHKRAIRVQSGSPFISMLNQHICQKVFDLTLTLPIMPHDLFGQLEQVYTQQHGEHCGITLFSGFYHFFKLKD